LRPTGLLPARLGPFAVNAGEVAQLGDLVVKRGGSLLVRLTADAPLDQVRGSFEPSEGAVAFASAAGGQLRFPALPPGSGALRIECEPFVAVMRSVEISEGAETALDVQLVTGVRQRLRIWAPATAATSGQLFWLDLRDAAGAMAWSHEITLPAAQGAPADTSRPFP